MYLSSKRKYELNFLLMTSLLVTVVNNLPYYSIFFSSNGNFPPSDSSLLEMVISFLWYTLQSLTSILLMSIFNYYWSRYFLFNISSKLLKILLLGIYNILISIILFKLSIYFAEIITGYPFGESAAYSYYSWKYVYIAPGSILIAYILALIIKKREVELNNVKLIEESLSNQIKTLIDQIKPHFLFNTLNTLSAVIRNEERDEGLKFVDDLANVYRYIIEKSNHNLVTLSNELEFATSYIRLLEKRFYNKFECYILIPDKYLSYLIPPLTIQLLIENAIKHNELSEIQRLNITVSISNNNIVVENNIQPKIQESSGLGIGLQNLNSRYKIITNKEIIIKMNDNFIVKLPLIEK